MAEMNLREMILRCAHSVIFLGYPVQKQEFQHDLRTIMIHNEGSSLEMEQLPERG